VSANERRKSALLAIARRVAAPLIPLLLGAAAMALILDSGTVHLPSIGSGSGAPPTAKVVVSSPNTRQRAHHAAVTPRASAPAPAVGSSAAGAPPVSANGAGSQVRTSGKQAPAHTQPSGHPAVRTPTVEPHLTGKFLPPLPHPGLALGHEDHIPPGLAHGHAHPGPPPPPVHPQHGPPPGHGHHGPPPGHGHHGPPGPPPGPKHHHGPPGKARKEDPPRPRQARGGKSHCSHGHGHGHGRGH
jgi:hypothetical protein